MNEIKKKADKLPQIQMDIDFLKNQKTLAEQTNKLLELSIEQHRGQTLHEFIKLITILGDDLPLKETKGSTQQGHAP